MFIDTHFDDLTHYTGDLPRRRVFGEIFGTTLAHKHCG